MIFKNIISGPIFCADAPDIVIETATAAAIDISINIQGESWPITISPVPAVSGYSATIRTKDILESLVQPQDIGSTGGSAPQVTITADNGTDDAISMTFQALYGSAGGKTPADMSRHWMSWRDQISNTVKSASEMMTFIAGLNLLGWKSGTYSVNAKIYTASGTVQQTLASGTISNLTEYHTVDASPSAVLTAASLSSCQAYDLSFSLSGTDAAGNAATLVSYPMRMILATDDTRLREFIFVNSLGVEDRVIAYGIRRSGLDGGSSKFINNGIEHENSNDAQEQFEIYSGSLSTSRSVEQWLEFLKSAKRFLKSSGLQSIVIDEYDTDIQEGELCSVSFRYRLGKRQEGTHHDDSESIGDYDPAQRYGALVIGDIPDAVNPPAEDLFFLKNRLDEFPLVSLSEDYLFLVQSPVSYHWGAASLSSIKEWLQKTIDYDGISLASVWASLKNTTTDQWANDAVALAHIPSLPQSKVTGLAEALAGKADRASLADVATTGSWNDLKDRPSIPQGTVTSVGLTAPEGFTVSGSPVTASGTLALSFAAGYSLPTTARQKAWDGHLGDTDIHVTAQERETWDGHVDDGDIHVTAEQKTAWDTASGIFVIQTDGSVKLNPAYKGLWADGFISAHGEDGSAGTGGGADLSAVWASLKNTVEDSYRNDKIAKAHIPSLDPGDITGLETALAGKADRADLEAETAARESADAALGDRIDTEITARKAEDAKAVKKTDVSVVSYDESKAIVLGSVADALSTQTALDKARDADEDNAAAIAKETTARKAADTALDTRVTAIEGKIPATASASNKLADTDFVNSSIATATATFRGTFDTLEALKATEADKNDYAFYVHKDEAGNTCYDKYTCDGAEWKFEYRLNNSSFTAAQWAAVNSGITGTAVTKLSGIAEGAQVNVIETVRLGGTALPVSGKAVDITGGGIKSVLGISDWALAASKPSYTTAEVTEKTNLYFTDARAKSALSGHTGDTTIHVTAAERKAWNAKWDYDEDTIKAVKVNAAVAADKATQLATARSLWGNSFNGTADVNGDITLGSGKKIYFGSTSYYIELKDGSLHTNVGLYSDSFISARGADTSAGSGGGASLDVVWTSLKGNTDGYKDALINAAHIPTLDSSKINGLSTALAGKQDKITDSNKLPYSLISGTPTIPTVGNGTVTIKQAGATKGSFTMNQSGATTIELTDSNTTYSSLAAASGGTAVSLVTTGEKYTWNAKQAAISDLATIRTNASTAYGWGDHSKAGYLKSVSGSTFISVSGSTLTLDVDSQGGLGDTGQGLGITDVSILHRYTYTIPPSGNKGVRINYNEHAAVYITVSGTNGGAQLVLIGTGYGEEGIVRNRFTEVVSPSGYYTWCLPQTTSLSTCIEIMSTRAQIDNVVVLSSSPVSFTAISALTSAKQNAPLALRSDLSSYLPLVGGTLTGPLKFNASSLPEQTTVDYLVSIDAFWRGGTMKWASINTIGLSKFKNDLAPLTINGTQYNGSSALTVNFPTSLPANGGNADTVDGYHVGVDNNTVSYYCPFPAYQWMTSNGYLTSEESTKDEPYFKALCKWLVTTYGNRRGMYCGIVNPNSLGYCHIQVYADTGSDGYPKYASGTYYALGGKTVNFGFSNNVWSWDSGIWSGYATVAQTLGRGGNATIPMTFYWSGQSGQPTWLWGGNDGTSMYVYNPSNFSVKGAGYSYQMYSVPSPASCADWGLTWKSGQLAKGTSAGNCAEGSGNNFDLYYYPKDSTVVSSTAANVMNLRFNWQKSAGYWHDLFMSPNNDSLWHRAVLGNTAKDWHRIVQEDGGSYNICASFSKSVINGAADLTSGLTTPGLDYRVVSRENAGSLPVSNNANAVIVMKTQPSTDYYQQLAFSSDGNMYHRQFSNAALNTTNAWTAILDAVNYKNFALPLTGGTVSGRIVSGTSGGMWYRGRDYASLFKSNSDNSDTWQTILSLKTVNGDWSLGRHGQTDVLSVGYVTDKDYSSNTNVMTYRIDFPTATGTIALTNGNVATATKLATARTIALSGYSSGSVSFDGSGNVTIYDTGGNHIKYVTGSTTDKPYQRLFYVETEVSYFDWSMLFSVDTGYSRAGGIYKAFFRTEATYSTQSCGIIRILNGYKEGYGYISSSAFFIKTGTDGSKRYWDVYFKAPITYEAVNIRPLNFGIRGSVQENCAWTMDEATRAAADIRTYDVTVECVEGGQVYKAETAPWSGITGKPTTLSGYGITDFLRHYSYTETADDWRSTAGMLRFSNQSSQPGAYQYGQMLTVYGGGDTFGQLYFAYSTNGEVFARTGVTSKSPAWVRMLNESNYSYYALPLSGGTLTGALTSNGSIETKGQLLGQSIEFRNMESSTGNGGYIDFHYNGSTTDYTSRIIEGASGSLSLLANTLRLGTDNSCILELRRAGYNYIWASTAGGVLSLGTIDSGATSFSNAALNIIGKKVYVGGTQSGTGVLNVSGDIQTVGSANRYMRLTQTGIELHVTATTGWATGLSVYGTDNAFIGCAAGTYGATNNLNYYYYGGDYNNANVNMYGGGDIYFKGNHYFFFNRDAVGAYFYPVDNGVEFNMHNASNTYTQSLAGFKTSSSFIVSALKIGANSAPAYALDVNGVIYSNTGIFSSGYVSARGQDTSSDINLKTDFSPIKNALDYVLKTHYTQFKWKDTMQLSMGIIAQEERGREYGFLVKSHGDVGHLTYDYAASTAILGAAIQEEDRKVEALKRRVAELENELRQLKTDRTICQ